MFRQPQLNCLSFSTLFLSARHPNLRHVFASFECLGSHNSTACRFSHCFLSFCLWRTVAGMTFFFSATNCGGRNLWHGKLWLPTKQPLSLCSLKKRFISHHIIPSLHMKIGSRETDREIGWQSHLACKALQPRKRLWLWCHFAHAFRSPQKNRWSTTARPSLLLHTTSTCDVGGRRVGASNNNYPWLFGHPLFIFTFF
jgi:hypothetical protein